MSSEWRAGVSGRVSIESREGVSGRVSIESRAGVSGRVSSESRAGERVVRKIRGQVSALAPTLTLILCPRGDSNSQGNYTNGF